MRILVTSLDIFSEGQFYVRERITCRCGLRPTAIPCGTRTRRQAESPRGDHRPVNANPAAQRLPIKE
jgi:hypothetical protein